MKHLHYLHESTWEEELAAWAERENDPIAGWKAFYEAKGFSTWDDWRRGSGYYRALGLDKATWTKYKIDPKHVAQVLHQMFCTSSPNWRKLVYEGDRAHSTFKDLAFHRHWEQHAKIEDMMKNFPQDTHLLGIHSPTHQQILVEGNHRAIALVRAAALGEAIHSSVTISMAAYTQEEFDRIWRNGLAMDIQRFKYSILYKIEKLLHR